MGYIIRRTGLFFMLLISVASAASTLDSLARELEQHPDADTTRVKILHELSRGWMKIDLERAKKYSEEALSISKDINYDEGYGQSLINLGDVHYYKGDYDLSVDYSLQAVSFYEKKKDYLGIAAVENNLGAVYYAQGKIKEALIHYSRSVEHYAKINDRSGIARVQNNIGNLYFSTDDLENALLYYEKSLALKQEMNDRDGIAMSLNNIGNVYGTKGDFEKSRDYFIRSMKISEELNDIYAVAMTMNNIGLLYQMEGDTTEALIYMRRSLKKAESIHALDLEKDAWISISELYQEHGRYKQALESYKKYIQVKDSLLDEQTRKNIDDLKAKYESEKQAQVIENQTEEISREKKFNNLLSVVIVLGIVFAVYLVYSNIQRRKANQLLRDQKHVIQITNDELSEKNKNITDSILYASRIQQAMLPPSAYIKTNFPDSFVYFSPKDIVSGDFYWMENSGKEILFAVADCTGHGVPGAFMSVAGSNLLTESVTQHHLTNPGLILDEINRGLAKMLHQDSNDEMVRDGMDIALCAFDKEKHLLRFSGAFNPLWIIRGSEIMEYRGDKYPVGAYVDKYEVKFSTTEIQLLPGDTLYIFSDGYSDQFGGEHGKKLKDSNFKKILLSVQHLPMAEQMEFIRTSFQQWKGDLEQIDDVCVMGIRF
ncbi:MAG: tetratricopeptide repeat protein [Flavobacteriales bacterium]|nr:tetratricopeptide repeat protein [Flavobacteriales bacterium]